MEIWRTDKTKILEIRNSDNGAKFHALFDHIRNLAAYRDDGQLCNWLTLLFRRLQTGW